ncbi:MAG: NINE protein [Pseudomonadales bacterium]
MSYSLDGQDFQLADIETPSQKSYVIAVCLSAIFGVVGIQHFYMGRYVEATIDLGLFLLTLYFFFTGQNLYAIITFALDGLHTLIVTFMLLTGTFRDGDGHLICYPGQKLKQGNTT